MSKDKKKINKPNIKITSTFMNVRGKIGDSRVQCPAHSMLLVTKPVSVVQLPLVLLSVPT